MNKFTSLPRSSSEPTSRVESVSCTKCISEYGDSVTITMAHEIYRVLNHTFLLPISRSSPAEFEERIFPHAETLDMLGENIGGEQVLGVGNTFLPSRGDP